MENKLPQSNQQPKKTRWVTFPFLTHITLLLPVRCILVRPKHWIMKVSSDPSITARYCLPQWQPTSCKSLCSLIYLFCASSSNCCMKLVRTAKYLLPKTEAFTQANRIFSSSQQRAIPKPISRPSGWWTYSREKYLSCPGLPVNRCKVPTLCSPKNGDRSRSHIFALYPAVVAVPAPRRDDTEIIPSVIFWSPLDP